MPGREKSWARRASTFSGSGPSRDASSSMVADRVACSVLEGERGQGEKSRGVVRSSPTARLRAACWSRASPRSRAKWDRATQAVASEAPEIRGPSRARTVSRSPAAQER